MKIRKVLITQSQIKNYAGSEIATLELAKHFTGIGAKVHIVTTALESPMRQYFEEVEGITITLQKDTAKINVKEFDLLWIHHQFIPEAVVSSLRNNMTTTPLIIYSHMSASEPLEFPIHFSLEDALADLVLFNAEEIKDNLAKSGVNFSEDKVYITANPAPDSFFITGSPKKKLSLKKIAVISNHPPDEILSLKSIPEMSNVAIDYIGRKDGGTPQLVTRNFLESYDVVISIGKTVQYCIAAGVVPYCYDRYGGSGFLSINNFEKNRYHNFSGRGFKKKTAQQIAQSILSDFDDAQDSMFAIREKYAEQFRLSTKITEIIKKAERNYKNKKQIPLDIHWGAQIAYTLILSKLLPDSVKLRGAVKNKLDKLELEHEKLVRINSQLQEELLKINNSKTMRFAKIVKKIVGYR